MQKRGGIEIGNGWMCLLSRGNEEAIDWVGNFALQKVHKRPVLTNYCSLRATASCLLHERSVVFSKMEIFIHIRRIRCILITKYFQYTKCIQLTYTSIYDLPFFLTEYYCCFLQVLQQYPWQLYHWLSSMQQYLLKLLDQKFEIVL